MIMATQTVQRHPLRGAAYGLLLGIGVAIYLVLFAITPFRWSTVAIVAVAVAALGALWGAFAPVKRPEKGSPEDMAMKEYAETEARAHQREQALQGSAAAGAPDGPANAAGGAGSPPGGAGGRHAEAPSTQPGGRHAEAPTEPGRHTEPSAEPGRHAEAPPTGADGPGADSGPRI